MQRDGFGLSERMKDNCEYRQRESGLFVREGLFHFEHWRPKKSGGLALLYEEDGHNLIASEGLHAVLDIAFRNQTQIAHWYFGLVDNAGFSAFANADTMASHGGWAENEDYDEAARQEWVTIAAASRHITNTSVAVFTMNATATIHGFFLSSSSTKGGSTGKLWCAGALSTNRAVVDDDLIKLTYQINGPA